MEGRVTVPFAFYLDGNDSFEDWEIKGPFDMIARKKDGSFLVWHEDPEEVKKNRNVYSRRYNYYRFNPGNYQNLNLQVEWVAEPKAEYIDRFVLLAYGIEPSLGYLYH